MPDLRKRLQRTLAGLDAPGLVEPAAADITVVGLGPGDPGHLTRAAGAALAGARVVWLRTTGHPGAASIPAGIPVHSCDDLYVAHATFDAVYHAIAARLVDAARDGPVVYAVPGDPGVGETSVRYLLRAAGQHDLSVQVLPGVSFLEPTLAAIGWDAFDGLQIVDATAVGEQHHPQLDPGLPAIVGQVYSRLVASDLKLTLLNQYPPEHAVTLITGAGAGPAPGTLQADDAPVGLRVLTLPLHELDHHEIFDDLTSLAIPPLGFPGSLLQLAEAVAHLRAPDGCPWDLAQTHDSLRPYLLEEAHEALAALDAEDMPALAEELGDLLLQIVLHAQIAVEEGDFSLSDVIRHITEKIWRRHPHVFGDGRADTVDEVLTNWEALKRAERASKGSADAADPFTGIPVSLPALARAQAVQDRALRLEKLAGSAVGATAADPIEGLQAALQALNAAPADADVRAARLGDALWQLVALARAWELDAETALREHTGAVVAARPSEPGGIA